MHNICTIRIGFIVIICVILMLYLYLIQLSKFNSTNFLFLFVILFWLFSCNLLTTLFVYNLYLK